MCRIALAVVAVAFGFALLVTSAAHAKGSGAAACGAGALCVVLDGPAAAAVTRPALPVAPPWDPGPALRVQVTGPHESDRAPWALALHFVPRDGLLRAFGGAWSRPATAELAALRAATAGLGPYLTVRDWRAGA